MNPTIHRLSRALVPAPADAFTRALAPWHWVLAAFLTLFAAMPMASAQAPNTFANTGSLATARNAHTATLLPNGKVLVAGGYRGTVLASAEFYDVGLGFSASWQPQITSASFSVTGQLVLTGSGFKGISGASGGNSQESPTDYPVVQVR